jgi:NCAIR mutase (PurE)-related protein
MDKNYLTALLNQVKSGELDIESAVAGLRSVPGDPVADFALLDTHRALRTGMPEVVYCPGKTKEQVAQIVQKLAEQNDCVLATRATSEQFNSVQQLLPHARFHELARLIIVGEQPVIRSHGYVAVLTAGTSDIPVAEEAALTLEYCGTRVQRCYDVGVAGLHRLLSKLDIVRDAQAIIVCAGMEGALVSVVAGLVSKPVVAVPTSVGYGASFGGIAALLSMLNSCAGGVAVVNIDNGFGAAVMAYRIMSV